MLRQGRSIAVVGVFLIGCAVLLVVGCAGTNSETSKKGQEPTEATMKEQTRSPEATASEEARCEVTRASAPAYTTNDLPGCPKGGSSRLPKYEANQFAEESCVLNVDTEGVIDNPICYDVYTTAKDEKTLALIAERIDRGSQMGHEATMVCFSGEASPATAYVIHSKEFAHKVFGPLIEDVTVRHDDVYFLKPPIDCYP